MPSIRLGFYCFFFLFLHAAPHITMKYLQKYFHCCGPTLWLWWTSTERSLIWVEVKAYLGPWLCKLIVNFTILSPTSSSVWGSIKKLTFDGRFANCWFFREIHHVSLLSSLLYLCWPTHISHPSEILNNNINYYLKHLIVYERLTLSANLKSFPFIQFKLHFIVLIMKCDSMRHSMVETITSWISSSADKIS